MSESLESLIDELEGLAKDRNDAWQIPRAEGEALRQLAVATQAQTVVEVGTSYGFSGLFWLDALRVTDGHLHTIDNDPKKHESAKKTFERVGLASRVTLHLADSIEALARLKGPFDLVFIDADKARTVKEFEAAWPKLRPYGSLLVDNTLTHTAELKDFLQLARKWPKALNTELAVGNGVQWLVKLP